MFCIDLHADEAQQAEADQMLRAMLKVQESNPKQAAAQNTLVAHSLAMLWFLGGSPDKVRCYDDQ